MLVHCQDRRTDIPLHEVLQCTTGVHRAPIEKCHLRIVVGSVIIIVMYASTWPPFKYTVLYIAHPCLKSRILIITKSSQKRQTQIAVEIKFSRSVVCSVEESH